jgi:PKD repeat protein
MNRSPVCLALLFSLVAVSFIGCPPKPSPLPVAAFDVTPTSGQAPLAVTFTDESSPGTSGIASWGWSFGDSTVGSGQFVNHTYNDPGTYTVTLTVSDTGGSISTAQETITVTAPSVPFDIFDTWEVEWRLKTGPETPITSLHHWTINENGEMTLREFCSGFGSTIHSGDFNPNDFDEDTGIGTIEGRFISTDNCFGQFEFNDGILTVRFTSQDAFEGTISMSGTYGNFTGDYSAERMARKDDEPIESVIDFLVGRN